MQTWLLYHDALSSGILMNNILKTANDQAYTSASSKGEADNDLVNSLKGKLEEQAQLIQRLHSELDGYQSRNSNPSLVTLEKPESPPVPTNSSSSDTHKPLKESTTTAGPGTFVFVQPTAIPPR